LGDTSTDQPIVVPWGESIPLFWIVWHVVEHEIHHRGELSLLHDPKAHRISQRFQPGSQAHFFKAKFVNPG